MLKIISILFLSLMLHGCGGSAPATATSIPVQLRVAALGDSITQAFMCDRDPGDVECYPRSVQSKAWPAKLAALNPKLNVSNYASAGCKMAYCTYEFAMSKFLPADYIVMLYGVNEAGATIPVDAFIATIRSAIDARPIPKYIIIKPPLRFPAADPTTDSNFKLYLPQYRAALDSLNGPGVTVIDPLGTTDWWCDITRDQHPCEPAHDAIAKAVNAAIK
jgi:hypothetical protein